MASYLAPCLETSGPLAIRLPRRWVVVSQTTGSGRSSWGSSAVPGSAPSEPYLWNSCRQAVCSRTRENVVGRSLQIGTGHSHGRTRSRVTEVGGWYAVAGSQVDSRTAASWLGLIAGGSVWVGLPRWGRTSFSVSETIPPRIVFDFSCRRTLIPFAMCSEQWTRNAWTWNFPLREFAGFDGPILKAQPRLGRPEPGPVQSSLAAVGPRPCPEKCVRSNLSAKIGNAAQQSRRASALS